jgi:hypothetical protein
MTEATLPPVEKLDALLAVVDRCEPADEAEFAHEHIQEARTYALGAMPQECEWSLTLAQKTLAAMPDTEECARAKRMLADLRPN